MDIIEMIPAGKDNAISMRDIGILCGLSDREVRKAILDARYNGKIICSYERGYYLPEHDTDILAWYKMAKARGLATLKSLKYARQHLKDNGIDPDV